VTVVIAILVVLYFDDRVRGAMTPRERGYAIGWLGGILTAGIFVPVMVLAGFVPDTGGVRTGTVITVSLFLLGAFGVAISAWGREDGRRLRDARARPPVPPVPPVPVPGPHLPERERAAEVLGYAFTAVAFCATAFTALTRPELPSPADRALARELLRQWADRWAGLAPALAAIAVGYPSPQVREHVKEFMETGGRVVLAAVKSPRPQIRPRARRVRSWRAQRMVNSRRWQPRSRRSSARFSRRTAMARTPARAPPRTRVSK
jgi:hypothetical protein